MVFGVLVLVGILFALVRIAKKKYEVNQEIAELSAQIARIEEENRQLDKLLAYYNTDYYKEKVAREELALQKEGEEAIAVPENVDKSGNSAVERKEQGESENETKFWQRMNPYRWWHTFF